MLFCDGGVGFQHWRRPKVWKIPVPNIVALTNAKRSYPCGNRLITSGFGEACFETSCCSLDGPFNAVERPICCPDGSWRADTFGTSEICGNGQRGEICPPTCEICPCGYFDGCNECGCDSAGNLVGCSRRFCFELEAPYCRSCSDTRDNEFTEGNCDPDEEPGRNGRPFCTDGYTCCPNGQW